MVTTDNTASSSRGGAFLRKGELGERKGEVSRDRRWGELAEPEAEP